MSSAPTKQASDSASAPAPEAEPVAQKTPAPVWPFVALGVLLYGGGLYVDARGGGFNTQVYEPYRSLEEVAALQPKSSGDEAYEKGKRIFVMACQNCHQASGMGAPGQYPPLVSSDWVLAESPNRIIRLVLNGGQGPIPINGQMFNPSATMPPWKDVYKDEDIAAVLTFVRGNKEWGNHAAPVKPEQVKAIREKVKDKPDAWTAPELLAIPLGND
jgi:mono/diheme cytochrome c family protein